MSEVRNHDLKIEPEFLAAKKAGLKLFEIRRDDRDYQVGETVTYREDGLQHVYKITYITAFMQQRDYVVFGEELVGVFEEETIPPVKERFHGRDGNNASPESYVAPNDIDYLSEDEQEVMNENK